MGTTSEKLTYLNTTKGKIKDSINLTGAGLTTEPFRQYAVKLKDAYVDIINNGTDTLYNNFPKVSESGTDLSLQNTYEAPMKSTLKGNTSQVQLSGKNKMYVNDIPLTSRTDVSYSCTDGVLTLNGTLTSGLLIDFDNFNLPAGTYIFNSWAINMTGSYARYFIDNDDSNNNRTNGGNPITLTSTHSCHFRFYANAGTVFTNAKVYAQIELGETRTDYEQYCGGTPSPNPSYPQDIHNVSGNNSIVICGKNLCNLLDQTKTIATNMNVSVSNQIITFNGSWSGGGNWVEIDAKFSLGAGTYKLSKDTTISNFTISGMYDSISQTWVYFKTADNFILTLNNQVNITKVRGWTNGLGTLNNATYKIQIEQGNQATTYEAYNGTTYNIDLPVENLFNNVAGTYTKSGLTFVNNGTSIKVIGTVDSSHYPAIIMYANGSVKASDWWGGSTDINQSKGYFNSMDGITISSNVIGTSKYTIALGYEDTAVSYWQNVDGNQSGTISTGKINFVSLGFTPNEQVDLDIKIQLEQGSKANSYTPYGTTPIELNKIGTYQDSFLRNTGKNLFDKDNANIIHLYATATGFAQNNNANSIYIPIQEGKTYTVSSTNRSLVDATPSVSYTNKIIESTSDTYLQRTMWGTNDNSITTTAPSGATYMYVYVKWSTNQTDINNCLATIQIEEGSTATSYEPYGNGEWYLHKEIGKVVLDGSESDSDYGTGTTGSFTRFGYNPFQNTNLIKSQSDYVSNYFKYLGTIGGDTTEAGISNTAISNLNRLFIFIPTSLVSTISAFKTWLSTHNTSVYYQLATSTNTEITDTTLLSQLEAIYNAKSKNGTTNINQENNDLPFVITASALEKEV